MSKYTVVIVTNRNYGLYGAFSTKILGISTCILYLIDRKKKLKLKEDKIWPHETTEDYLISVAKLDVPIIYINEIFYYQKEKEITINYYLNIKNNPIEHINCTYIIFALHDDHILLPKQKVCITNLSFKKNLYVMGEKALYPAKIFKQDIYTGEANLISQSIFQDIHNSKDNITIHSTSLKN
jgi:hypothetical protein